MFPDDDDDDDDDDGQNNISLAEARSELDDWIRCGSNGVNYQALEIFNQSVNCDPGHLLVIRGYISFRPSSTGRQRLNDLWENFKSQVRGFHHHFYADALIIGRKQFAWTP